MVITPLSRSLTFLFGFQFIFVAKKRKEKKISCTFDTVPFQNVAINLKFVLVAMLNKTFINMNDFFQLLT